MSLNDYAVLGLSTASSETEVRAAFRKLAMKHHPDRGGDAEKFKDAKAAFEAIERAGFVPPPPPRSSQGFSGTSGPKGQWAKPETPGNTWRDTDNIHDIFQDLKKANKAADPRNRTKDYTQPMENGELVARVSLREAFSGFNMVVPQHSRNGGLSHHSVNIPPGTPDGYRGKYKTSGGTNATIITRIETGPYQLRGFDDQNNLFSAGMRIGDIEIHREVDALDLIIGAWIETEDFLGERLNVRIPAGFDPRHRLKVANKGYYGWLQEYGRPSNNRMDMYIRLLPIFRKPEEIDPSKVQFLYDENIASQDPHVP